MSLSNKLFLLTFVVSCVICAAAQASDPVSLNIETAYQKALENNKEIIAARKTLDKARLELKTASRFFQENPDLTGEVKDREKADSEAVTDYGVSLSLPLEIRGQRSFRRQKSEKDVRIAELLLNRRKQEIKTRINKLFLEYYVLTKKMEFLKKIAGPEGNLLEIMETRAQYGESPVTELNTIKIEAAKTKEAMLQIKERIAINRQNIATIMFVQIDPDVKLEFNLPDYSVIPDIQQIVQFNQKHNFKIMNSQFERDKTSLDYQLAKSDAFMPKVSFSLTYAREDQDDVIGGAVSIPIPFVNSNKTKVLTAQKNVEIKTLDKENMQQKITAELQQEYLLIANLADRKAIYEQEILPLAQQNIDIMEALYKKGEIDFLALEKLWDQWQQSNNEYLDILQNYYQALFSLEMLSGGSLKEMVMGGEDE